jgi:hypothetical protein
MVFGLNENVIVFPLADIITPLAPVVDTANASPLSEATVPLSVTIDVIVFESAAELTLNVIVLPLTLVVTPVPPANVTSVAVFDATTFPSSPIKVLIIGVAALRAADNVATLTLLETAVPVVFVVTTSKSLLASELAAVSSVSFGIMYSYY